MNSIQEEARQHAFLHQYLAHQAITLHGADSMELDIATGDHRAHLTLQAPEEGRDTDPPQPPPKAMPPGVAGIHQSITKTSQGRVVHWSWEEPSRHPAGWVAQYTRELLQFLPARLTLRGAGADIGTGGLDPRTHGAVPGLVQELDQHNTLLAVIASGEPSLDWTSPENAARDELMRPNIIFPHGLARTSRQLGRSAGATMFTGQLEPGQPRAPAREVRMEFRVVSTQDRRQRLRHPDLPGLSRHTIESAIREARRLVERWVREMEQQGLSVLVMEQGRHQQRERRIFPMVPSQPYGRLEFTLAAHPVRLADEHLDASLQRALEGALAAHTRYTAVPDHGVETVLRVESIRGTTHDDPPLEVEFHTAYGLPQDDPGAYQHHLVRPMREITAQGVVTSPDGMEEALAFPVPVLMTINREARDIQQMHRLYLTAEGRPSLTHEQLRRLLGIPQLSDQQADTITHVALEGRTEAFREELWAILGHWEPRAGWPDREVTVTFDREGIHLEEPEE